MASSKARLRQPPWMAPAQAKRSGSGASPLCPTRRSRRCLRTRINRFASLMALRVAWLPVHSYRMGMGRTRPRHIAS